ARLNAVDEVLDHPQLVARDRWRTVATPAGEVRAIRSAVEPVGESPMLPVPALGADTDRILGELGLTDDDIHELRRRGVVA
ncbi:MAG: CoA transferase, partial [Frankiales bacterium]|nr:CoA transferase [Frankiales bacterium]